LFVILDSALFGLRLPRFFRRAGFSLRNPAGIRSPL
jgi:hypothetical protein